MARQTSYSDIDLAIRVQHGDLKALEMIIDKYQEPLMRYANYLGAQHLDDDVVQDTFIKIYQNINSYDPSKQFSSWIYRIAHNTTISYLRKHKLTIPWEEYLDPLIHYEPIDPIEQSFSKDQVKQCLSNLKLHYRLPLALYYLEDKSYEEISEILRLPVSTVGARISRAKKQMRELCQKN